MKKKSFLRAVAALLSVMLFLPVVPSAAEVIMDEPHTLFKTDFNSRNKKIWNRIDGAAYFADSDEDHNVSMAMNMDADVKLWKYFDNSEKYKVFHIGFEAYAEYQYVNSGFKLLSKKIDKYDSAFAYEAFFIKLNPLSDWHIGFPRNQENFDAPENLQNEFKYTPQKWYKVDLWVDLKEKNLFCYLDGQYYGRTALPDGFDNIYGMVYTSSHRDIGHTFLKTKPTGKPELWIDNFAVEGFLERSPFNNYKSASEYVPDELTRTLALDFSTVPGNIFFEAKAVDFVVGIKDCSGEAQRVKVNYSITDDGGNIIEEQNEEIELKPDERYEKNVKMENRFKYGYYVFKTTVIDQGGKQFVKKQKFSNLHTVKDGVLNPKMGINNHLRYNYGKPDIMLPLEQKIGISTVRDSMSWEEFEPKPYVYNLTEGFVNWTNEARKNNLEILTAFSWGNPNRNVGSPPMEDYEFEAWGEYVYEFVKQNKGRVKYYSVWNEYNARFSLFNNRGGTADHYYKLLKSSYINAKLADPDCKIVGIVSARYDEAFTRRVFELGGGDYLDVVDNHPYPMNYAHGPEEGKVEETTRSLLNLMKEFGLEDKECWMSEIGYSSGKNYMSETDQANYAVRTAAISEELVDKYFWYVSICKPTTDDLEANFGFLRIWEGNDIPYEAKPAFLAISNWNALMTGSVPCEKHFLDGDVRAYRFKRADGSDAYVIWTVYNAKNIALKLGAESAELYDIYGNRQTLNAIDGAFNIRAAQEPIYLTGSFSEFEETAVTVSTDMIDEISLCKNDVKSVNIENTSGKNLFADFTMPKNISSANGKNELSDGKSIIGLQTGENTDDSGNIILKINDGEKCVYWAKSAVKYIEDAEAVLNVVPAGKNWQGMLKVKNNTETRSAAPLFRINSPCELSVIGDISVMKIAPQNERTVRFNIPGTYRGEEIKLDGELVFETGERQNVSKTANLHAVAYALKQPVIDGSISSDEWTAAPIVLADKLMIRNIEGWMGPDDLSASVYLMYDEKNFYISAKVKDDILGFDRNKRPWAGDSLQFAVSSEHVAGSPQTEIALALLDEGKIARRYLKKGVSVDEICNDDIEYEIKRNDGETIYEASIPWDTLIDSYNPKKADTLNFSVIINDNDGIKRRGWIEFGGGIGSGKNPYLYKELPFEKGIN